MAWNLRSGPDAGVVEYCEAHNAVSDPGVRAAGLNILEMVMFNEALPNCMNFTGQLL
ncbi:MAG: hypothetical protein WC593_10455 [Methanoregula sp.]